MRAYTIHVSALSLFSCCLPREPAALARGTCQACVYRTRSRYPGTRQLPLPMELVVQCAEGSFHPAVLRARDWHVTPCSLTAVGGGGGGRISSRATGENRLEPCTESPVEKESLFGKGFCLRSLTLLPGAFQVLLCSWPHVSGVLMPTLVGIATGAPMLGLTPGAIRNVR